MKRRYLVSIGLLLALGLNSCDSPTGQGAGYGAAAGAILGAAATGKVRGGAVGAAICAATGALIGATVETGGAARDGPPPPGGFTVVGFSRRTGFLFRPY